MTRKTQMILSVVCFFVASIGGYVWAKQPRGPRDLLQHGDIDGAMEQARQYMAALQANGWDRAKTDREHPQLIRLPDQDYAQDAAFRSAWNTFAMAQEPIYADEVAFYTNLYVQRDFEMIPGIEGRTTYRGFFIVGWKDGRVTQVPVSDVRIHWDGARGLAVFPGMSAYNPSFRRLGSGSSDAKM